MLIFVLSLIGSGNDVTTPTAPRPDSSEVLLRVYSGPHYPAEGSSISTSEHRSALTGLSIGNFKVGYSLYATHHTVYSKVWN